MLRKLSLSKRVIMLATIFLLPLLLLAYFLVIEKLELITFARQEVDGVRFLRPAHRLLGEMGNASIQTSDVERSAAALVQINMELGLSFGVTEPTNAAVSGARAARDLAAAAAATQKLTDRIATVADKSNLSLDPDLDSYY